MQIFSDIAPKCVKTLMSYIRMTNNIVKSHKYLEMLMYQLMPDVTNSGVADKFYQPLASRHI